MTPEQFAERMKEIALNTDLEMSHGDADDLMCELLVSLGYAEGVYTFVDMDKWYA